MKAFSVRFVGVSSSYSTVNGWGDTPVKLVWCEQHYIAEGETPEDVVKDGMARGYFLDYWPNSITGVELVKRYRLFIDDQLFDSHDGRFSFETKEEAETRASAFRNSESARRHHGDLLDTLEVRECWCYPHHFDPSPLRRVSG